MEHLLKERKESSYREKQSFWQKALRCAPHFGKPCPKGRIVSSYSNYSKVPTLLTRKIGTPYNLRNFRLENEIFKLSTNLLVMKNSILITRLRYLTCTWKIFTHFMKKCVFFTLRAFQVTHEKKFFNKFLFCFKCFTEL